MLNTINKTDNINTAIHIKLNLYPGLSSNNHFIELKLSDKVMSLLKNLTRRILHKYPINASLNFLPNN